MSRTGVSRITAIISRITRRTTGAPTVYARSDAYSAAATQIADTTALTVALRTRNVAR